MLSELNKAKSDTIKVNILNELSWNYINYAFDLALEYAQDALNLAKKYKFYNGIALAYTHIAYAYHRKGNFDEALININKAIGIYEVLNKKYYLSKCLLTVSQIYFAMAEYDKALDYSLQSLEMKLENSDSSSLELNYLTIGVIYQHQGDYVSALENLLISVDYCIKNKNNVSLASNYNNIAVIYRNQKKNKSRQKRFDRPYQ